MASLTTFSFSLQIQYSADNDSIEHNFSELVKYIQFQVSIAQAKIEPF